MSFSFRCLQVGGFEICTFNVGYKSALKKLFLTLFTSSILLSLLIYSFATLTCCEGRKEAEHAGDARWIMSPVLAIPGVALNMI